MVFVSIFIYPSISLCKKININEVSDEEISRLSKSKLWHSLIYYSENKKKSSVLSKDFFLSKKGRESPEKELKKLIDLYKSPYKANPNKNPICRFPARYYWLSQNVDLQNFQSKLNKCQKLQSWALTDNVESFSVLMVSGYLGNPASTFGHALIKFNTIQEISGTNLFDLTLNYGALIPQDEGSLSYVVKGLTGGYKAGFSDRYYYNQDIIYSRTELRDIWEYKIYLNDFEKKLFLYHIWEIVGKKFKYYFLKENCAYKIAELLDIFIDENILDDDIYWYAPVDLFYKLVEIDKHRSQNNKLISNISYIPSSQRRLHAQFSLLDKKEKEITKSIIKNKYKNINNQIANRDNKSKITILNSLMEYHHYLDVSKGDSSSEETRHREKSILQSRYKLPIQNNKDLKIRQLDPPTKKFPPIRIGFGINFSDNIKSYETIEWSPYSSEITGNGSSQLEELVVLDTSLGFKNTKNYFFLEKVDILKIINLNTLGNFIDEENQWSWKLRLGIDKNFLNDKYDINGDFGFGKSWSLNNNLTIFGMLDFSLHTTSGYIRASPQVGLFFKLEKTSLYAFYGYEFNEKVNYSTDIVNIRTQYDLGKSYSVNLGCKKSENFIFNLGISYYY